MNKANKAILIFLLALTLSVLPFGIKNIGAATPKYDYEIVYQSPYPSSLPTNSITNVYLELKNTGNTNWYKNGIYQVRLGSGSAYGSIHQKRDYKSEFANNNWLSDNRPSAIVNAEVVKPGEIARFQFDIKTPQAIGTYKAYFTPVVDGYLWMKDIGIYWEITTTDAPPNDELITNTSSTTSENPQEKRVTAETITKDSIIDNYKQSIVKLVCYDNEKTLQQGSGTLIYNEKQNPDFPDFYIITNRHVVEPSDGSSAYCSIYLYPENNPSLPLKFEGFGFKEFGNNLDLAVVEPKTIEGERNFYGKIDDLMAYSKSNKEILLRDFTENKNLISIVFGFPRNGYLKITDGSLLGIENYRESRFINTLAPVDHGNSGGLAIDSEGYLLGIPTNKSGAVGMLLDIEYIVNDLGIKIL